MTAEFTLCRVVTLGVGSDAPTAGTIDLCGLPWRAAGDAW